MAQKNHISAFVKDYNRNSAQIEYLNKSPTSILTKLDPRFSYTIESQSNPALAYKNAMNNLYQEQLNRGLRDKAELISQKNEEKEADRKDYESRINGVLCELQKNSLTHSLLLQKKMNQQEERKERFIDQSKLKGRRIDSFIESHQDNNVFNHQSDLYQQYQRSELQHSLSMNQLQKESHMRQQERMRLQKQREFQERMKFQQQLEMQKKRDRENRIQNQLKYQAELGNMVKEKSRQSLTESHSGNFASTRHNPITNPIEYHVENPYILKRMADNRNY